MEILSPAILAPGRRGWGRRRQARWTPLAHWNETHRCVCGCCSPPTAVLRSAVPPPARERGSPRSDPPCASGGAWGGGREAPGEQGGWKAAARVGVRIKRKEESNPPTWASATEQSSESLAGARPESLLSLQTKEIFKKPSPATPRPAHFFLMEFRRPSLGVRPSSSLSLPLLSGSSSGSLCPALPRSPLPPSPSLPLLPPPAPFPLRGSLAAALAPAPLSSAPGSALGLPGGRRRGARARGGATTLCGGGGAAVAPGTQAERRARPPALPGTDLPPRPETDRLRAAAQTPRASAPASSPRRAPHPSGQASPSNP